MGEPTRGRWCVQLRLGLEGEAVMGELWPALGEKCRAEVVERLARVMVNAVVTGSGQGGELSNEADDQECEECGCDQVAGPGEGNTRIA
jgi:hypothetical protein